MLEQVFRDDWGRVLASLVSFLGDIELAEDAAKDAFAAAAERWPRDGIRGQGIVGAENRPKRSPVRPGPASSGAGARRQVRSASG
jgi:hypothetical protein